MDPKLIAYYQSSLARKVSVLEDLGERLVEEPELGDEVRRIAHSLKGTGKSYGFPQISEVAAVAEAAEDGELLGQGLGDLLEVLREVARGDGGAE